MESFPVGYHNPAVDDCRIEETTPLVEMVAKRPVAGNGSAYVKIVHN